MEAFGKTRPLTVTDFADFEKAFGTDPLGKAKRADDHVDNYIFDGDFVLLAEDGGNFDKPERGVVYEVSGKFWVNNHAHILKQCRRGF